MNIIDQLPHIKRRVIPMDDDEQLMYRLKYGCEVVALDVEIEDEAIAEEYNGGYIFRSFPLKKYRVSAAPNEYVLTSHLHEFECLSDIVEYARIEKGYFGKISVGGMGIHRMWHSTDVTRNILSFNEFWKLYPFDDGYDFRNRISFFNICNARVVLSQERYVELASLYGDGFIILNINVPVDVEHVRVDEGVLFWFDFDQTSIQSYPTYFLTTQYKHQNPELRIFHSDYGIFKKREMGWRLTWDHDLEDEYSYFEFVDFWANLKKS